MERRVVFVHARPASGTFGDALGVIHTAGHESVLIELPGKRQHIGVASYRIVVRVLEMAAASGEAIEIRTSYKIIEGHLRNNRCGSAELMPFFRTAQRLVRETGSRVVFVPGRENPAVTEVLAAWRRAGHTVVFKGRSEPRARPIEPKLDPAVRAALIEAGWTPPNLPALAS